MRDRGRVAIMLSEEVDTNLEHEHVSNGKDQNLEPNPTFIKFHKKDGGSWTPDSTYILLFLSLAYSNIYCKKNVFKQRNKVSDFRK